MRRKKIIVTVLMLAIVAIGVLRNDTGVKAQAGPTVDFAEEIEDIVIKPGETIHIKMPIRVGGFSIEFPKVSVSSSDEDSSFIFSNERIVGQYENIATTIYKDSIAYVEFDVKAKESAKIKSYPININISGRYFDYFSEDGSYANSFDKNLNFNIYILEEKIPAQLTISKVNIGNNIAGNDTKLSFVVKNEGEIMARNTFIKLDYKDTGIRPKYSILNMKIGDLGPGQEYKLDLPVSILTTAEPGSKTIEAEFTYKYLDGDDEKSNYNILVNINENKEAPNVFFNGVSYKGELKPGNNFVVKASLQNYGSSKASNVKISVDESSISGESFMKGFFSDGIAVGDISINGKKEVEIPMRIASNNTGSNSLKLNITYEDNFGVEYSASETVYPEIIGTIVDTDTNLIISNVVQSPARPQAGNRLEISFDLENKGNVDVSDIKISTIIDPNTFIPVNTDPYQYLSILKAGEKKRIVIPLRVAESIKEGLNTLDVNIDYSGGSTISVPLTVLDVENNLGSSGMPRLIISDYSSDVEELKAGADFNFTFEIYNTNPSVDAQNITVTLVQDESAIFKLTGGSNSFYVDRIGANESIEKTLALQVKNDATTRAYPLMFELEYDYVGSEINHEAGKFDEIIKTEEKTLELNIQTIENYRPVVDYVDIYSWDGFVSMGMPATLSFEFYNMGKSVLNNVVVTVEGDFMSSTGNMYFIGNVMGGERTYAEIEVIPNMEGMAQGVLHITFEDSNGDEIEFTKEFESYVEGAQIWEPGDDYDYGEVFNPDIIEAKEKILPMWVFITIQVVVFVIALAITRKIIISIHKKKLIKLEDDMY